MSENKCSFLGAKIEGTLMFFFKHFHCHFVIFLF